MCMYVYICVCVCVFPFVSFSDDSSEWAEQVADTVIQNNKMCETQ
jgi:hypothetical protein